MDHDGVVRLVLGRPTASLTWCHADPASGVRPALGSAWPLVGEVVSVIRGKALGGELGLARAQEAVAALPTLVIDQIDVAQLVDRMWQLRGNLSAYATAYVAAAELLNCPVVTGDGRLAKAPGVGCEIKLISSG